MLTFLKRKQGCWPGFLFFVIHSSGFYWLVIYGLLKNGFTTLGAAAIGPILQTTKGIHAGKRSAVM